jgi:hypothetical protein
LILILQFSGVEEARKGLSPSWEEKMSGHAQLIRLFVAAASLTFFTFGSSAAELNTPRRTCTTADCQATIIAGRLNKSDRCCGFDNKPLPWVVQLYANKGECLRLHVTAQAPNTDTELVAIAPGTQRAWRNDNSGIAACTTCPLLKIRTNVNEEGWFLVQVNSNTGAPINGGFSLAYARYAATNPNCAAPTPQLPPQ